MSAAVAAEPLTRVPIDKRWSNRTGREASNHPLFTPRAKDMAVPRVAAVPPPPAQAERTILLPRLGEDGHPVTATTAEIQTGWSEVDNKLHIVDTALAPPTGGLWCADCGVLVVRLSPQDVDRLASDDWCSRCWGPAPEDRVREGVGA